ncbi:CRTAC1 family protein [Crateriforma conspicua]|uniref:CRTAC1 family protein n=1 Tax=Crateriforma conspicua TaxID=2527996 RepID=UPI001188FE28|nr:CRTAC1 family protein [Crateriforma conspicua]QDV61179.1 FG-GAP repeat protein [Crateriforma conspicua]
MLSNDSCPHAAVCTAHAVAVAVRAGLLGWVLLIAGCGGSPDQQTASQADPVGHQAMLQLLQQIKEAVGPAHSHREQDRLNELLQQAEQLPPGSLARIEPLALAGEIYLRLGETKRSIVTLDEALKLAQSAGDKIPDAVDTSIRFNLGMAYLRLGENENCLANHTIDSCLAPIRGSGVHTITTGSTRAAELFRQVLRKQPDDMTTRWLLNLAVMTLGEYPEGVEPQWRIPIPDGADVEFPRFLDRAGDLGLDITTLAGGAIVDDFNGDQLLDVVVSDWDPAGQIRFFRNNGAGGFVDETEAANLIGILGGLNLMHADYDNDGDLDILLLRGGWLMDVGNHPNSLLQNDGCGRFVDVTFPSGLAEEAFPTQTASWADYDGDGDLDLYIGNEQHPNQLFQNQNDGTFIDVASAAGVDDDGYSKAVTWGDFDGDDLPDIYVSNLKQANRLFQNQGDGTFVDVALAAGVTGPQKGFPVWFWDYNNDGALDLFATSYWQDISLTAASYLGKDHPSEHDHLYRNAGDGTFREVSQDVGLSVVTQPMGCNFGDLNNDGFLDFYLGTGYPEFEALSPNLMYLNQNGERFVDVSAAGGFGHLQKGHGVVFADIDQDGDQDVFHELGGWFKGDPFRNALFENPGFGNHWLAVQLVGTESNRCAIGARISLTFSENGTERHVYRSVSSGGSFGCNPLRQHVGVGKATEIAMLEVHWPTSGRTQSWSNIPVDQFIRVTEDATDFQTLPYPHHPFVSSHDGHHHHHHHH